MDLVPRDGKGIGDGTKFGRSDPERIGGVADQAKMASRGVVVVELPFENLRQVAFAEHMTWSNFVPDNFQHLESAWQNRCATSTSSRPSSGVSSPKQN